MTKIKDRHARESLHLGGNYSVVTRVITTQRPEVVELKQRKPKPLRLISAIAKIDPDLADKLASVLDIIKENRHCKE